LRQYSDDEIVTGGAQDGVERFGLRNPKYHLKKHSTLPEYRAALGEEQFRALYKFTCVRNPWDRLVSFYFRPSRGAVAWDRRQFKKLVLKTPSITDYPRLADEENPFLNVQRVTRFENLAEDLRDLCADLNIPLQTLPTYNRSDRDHYSAYYDDELKPLGGKRFAAEMERFGYDFEK
jgi:Sulfotransferase family